jgi:hypothetical protein
MTSFMRQPLVAPSHMLNKAQQYPPLKRLAMGKGTMLVGAAPPPY